MDGVNILNEYLVTYRVESIIVLFLAFLLGIVLIYFVLAEFPNYDGGCIFLFLVGFMAFFITLTNGLDNYNKQYMQYQVTISDSVSLNKFLEKYEIIDVDGKVYTVKEINNKE